MSLSDAEIEARLALLRRQREALDREIADLVLYRELGRRLGGGRAGTDAVESEATLDPLARGWDAPPGRDGPPRAGSSARDVPAAPPQAGIRSATRFAEPEVTGAIPPAIPFAEDAAGARRYGRALVEAARAAIAEAGRPLHAAEILAVLVGRGFTVPGRDPVAALNTRLWKRSGPDGPLRRAGEATYALAVPA